MCFQVTQNLKDTAKISRNNPLVLKGLKSVDLRIIQMYHFRLKMGKIYGMQDLVGLPTFWSETLTFYSGTYILPDESPELLFSKS